ncbi:MAG: AMP-binding protein [Novosphingobium sp.]
MIDLFGSLQLRAQTDPERIAIDSLCDAPLSYARLAAVIEELSNKQLEEHRLDRPVALQTDQGLDLTLLELALLRAGIPVLSLPQFFSPEQTRHALQTCGAQALYSGDGSGRFITQNTEPAALHPETARITFTSGSTGTPKGVCLSASHMLTVADAVVDAVGAEHAGRHLALLPPGILLETVAGLLPTLLAGGTYVAPRQMVVGLADPFKPDALQMLRTIADNRITSLILVPEYLAVLVGALEATGSRLPELTLVAVGGARTPPALLNRARALGLPVRQGYGLTECASVVSLERSGEEAVGSVGRALKHLTMNLAEDGEVLVSGPVALGTVGGPTLLAPLATGDIGRIDHAGRLFVEGRKSNLIITSFGRNVAPEWVEEVFLAQPGVAQALVYDDGSPQPAALLVPATADADLDQAVHHGNALLPAYAQVSSWREAAHFTPFNGQLTGNGRMRREVILRAYCGEPRFFNELEAATVRERIRFMQVPQLLAGLNGTISRDAYIAYLVQAFHHVSHTVPLLKAAREALASRPELVAALDEYVAEEDGHEEWILSDIAAAGGDAVAARRSAPAPQTRAMVEHAYHRIRSGNPVAFFGMVYVLESVSVALATRGAGAVAKNLGLPPEAFTYLTSHGSLDQDHMRFFAEVVNGLERPEDRTAIVTMAREIFHLYAGVFASVDLESPHVAA